jgi:hypothetical protein
MLVVQEICSGWEIIVEKNNNMVQAVSSGNPRNTQISFLIPEDEIPCVGLPGRTCIHIMV